MATLKLPSQPVSQMQSISFPITLLQGPAAIEMAGTDPYHSGILDSIVSYLAI